jgi:hypothetical protein
MAFGAVNNAPKPVADLQPAVATVPAEPTSTMEIRTTGTCQNFTQQRIGEANVIILPKGCTARFTP